MMTGSWVNGNMVARRQKNTFNVIRLPVGRVYIPQVCYQYIALFKTLNLSLREIMSVFRMCCGGDCTLEDENIVGELGLKRETSEWTSGWGSITRQEWVQWIRALFSGSDIRARCIDEIQQQ